MEIQIGAKMGKGQHQFHFHLKMMIPISFGRIFVPNLSLFNDLDVLKGIACMCKIDSRDRKLIINTIYCDSCFILRYFHSVLFPFLHIGMLLKSRSKG